MKKSSFLLLALIIFFSGVTSAYTIMDQKNVNWWEFIWGELTQGRPASLSASDWPEGFIIMDRNLGATSTDIYNKNSYGYYYQWWNNYGFSFDCNESNNNFECSNPYKSATFTRAAWKEEYFHKGYVWKSYIKLDLEEEEKRINAERDYWENDEHHNWVWGWENDYHYFGKDEDLGVTLTEQSMKNRQGPCPDGWHVPSIWEWATLMTYWAIDYQEKNKTKLDFNDDYTLYQIHDDEVSDEFIKTFKLPLAWYIDEASGNRRLGWWDYWSSSPFWLDKVGDKDTYFAYAVDLDASTSEYGGWLSNSNWSPRARGASVRCFKNEYKKVEKAKDSDLGNESSKDQSSVNQTTNNKSSNTKTTTTTTQKKESSNTADWFDNGDQSQMLSNWYTREYNNAYRFSSENGITTAISIENANMGWELTRIAMAKMLSNYAISVLWKTPNFEKSCNFDDVSSELNKKYDNWVTLACQLGIMGVGINNFRPYESVTRAQFGAALSRMLYGISDWAVNYYEPHLNRLAAEGVINNIDPKRMETRWNVMLMLMRSAISVDEVNSIINATIQAKEEKTNRKVNLITDEWPFKGYPEFDMNYWGNYQWTAVCQDENGILFYNKQGIDFVYLYEDENWKHTCTEDECMDDKWNIEKLLSNEKVRYWWDDNKDARRFSCTQSWVYLYLSRSSWAFENWEAAGLTHNNYNDRIIYTDKDDNVYGYLWFVELMSKASNIWDEYSDKLFEIEKWFNEDKEKYIQFLHGFFSDLTVAINNTGLSDTEFYEKVNDGYYLNYVRSFANADSLLKTIDVYLNQLKEIQKTIKVDNWIFSSSTKLAKMIDYLENFKKAVREWKEEIDVINTYMSKVSTRNGKYEFPQWWRNDMEKEGHIIISNAREFKKTFNTYQKYLIDYAKNIINKNLK